MNKPSKIYVRTDLHSYMNAEEVIEMINCFADENGVEINEIYLEREYYEDGGMYLETYRLETDDEFNKRVNEAERRKKEADAVDRQKYEELKKRFG